MFYCVHTHAGSTLDNHVILIPFDVLTSQSMHAAMEYMSCLLILK